ncbi:MAG: amidohydrolase family protein [Candidatus Thorarchaeota archaeon]|jgi:imidazolonepropionase-like amidohydrolase
MKEILLKANKIIVGDGTVLENSSILIAGETIKEVGQDLKSDKDATVLDYSDRIIMPGIVETHMHLSYDGTVADPNEVRKLSDEFLAIQGGKLAEKLLLSGITTACDAAARGNLGFAVREAVEKGVILGPRLLLCGRMITITGGRDAISGGNQADGPDDVRRAAREELGRGADFIKLAATGAISSASTESFSTQFTREELQAAVEEAHKVGKMTHAHAYGEPGDTNAILAGVDVLVHGHPLTKRTIELLLEHDRFLMPTLVTYYESQLHHDDGDLPEHMVRKEKEIYPLIEEGFRNAVKAGVKVVLGSDSGMPYTPFGKSSMEEMELMVKLGGMSEMDALVAGTGNAAKAIGLGSKVGTIEAGKSADILVLGPKKNPLKDIAILQDPESIALVMFKGTVHQRGSK